MTLTSSSRPVPGTSPTTERGMNEAAKSLVPHKTPHGHRPDWQTARDDQTESQRTG